MKKEVKIILIIVIVVLVFVSSILIYRHVKRFDYGESLNDIVLTIEDTSINLRELTYYIIEVEKTGQQYALIYDEENPLSYWNMYMNGDESGYVTDLAKRAAVDFCIRDNIYYKEAVAAGFELTEEELSDIRYDAQNYYELMTNRQREVSCLLPDDLLLIMTKETLAHKYIAYLADNDESGTLDSIMLKYDVGGTYFEGLLNKYSITQNDEILDEVRVGFITVN